MTVCEGNGKRKDSYHSPGKSLSILSLLILLASALGVIVRFWLQFSSQRGECDCSSGGGGRWGLPSKQSGWFYSSFTYFWYFVIGECPSSNKQNHNLNQERQVNDIRINIHYNRWSVMNVHGVQLHGEIRCLRSSCPVVIPRFQSTCGGWWLHRDWWNL